MELRNLIKIKRDELHISSSKLAEMVGVSQSTISRWERGDIATMKQSKVLALANALRVSPTDILDMPAMDELTWKEQLLIEKFNKLSCADQEEIMAIVDMKLKRSQQ